jgi:hypothetical protein
MFSPRSARVAGLCASLLLVAGAATSVHAQTPKPAAPAAEIVMDISQMTALTDYMKRAQVVADTWYPRIIEVLGADTTTLPKKITIVMDVNYDGVAATGGSEIRVSAKYVLKNPNDLGMIVHELAHVVQKYPKYNPVWLVEGIADYVRFFHYEPGTKVNVNPEKANARQSYRTTGAFLAWASGKYDKDLVRKLDAALKTDTYTEEMWQKLTGKTLDQLNDEWLTAVKAAQ